MASRPILPAHPVIQDGNMAGSLTSDVSIVSNVSMVSYDISWTGSSPVGTITVQVSNTYTQNGDGSQRDAGNWTTVSGISASVSGNSGNGFITVNNIAAYAIRLLYTRASGTGTLNVKIHGKVS